MSAYGTGARWRRRDEAASRLALGGWVGVVEMFDFLLFAEEEENGG